MKNARRMLRNVYSLTSAQPAPGVNQRNWDYKLQPGNPVTSVEVIWQHRTGVKRGS